MHSGSGACVVRHYDCAEHNTAAGIAYCGITPVVCCDNSSGNLFERVCAVFEKYKLAQKVGHGGCGR